MHFGKYLLNHHVPGWFPYYLPFYHFKKLIEAPTGFQEELFANRILEESRRIDLFISGKIVEILNLIRYLSKNIDNATAENVANEITRIETFSKHNLEAFRKIIKKFKKLTGGSVLW